MAQASSPNLPDLSWARSGAVAGIIALLAYVVLSAVDAPGPVAVMLSFAFGFGFTIASIGLYLGVTRDVAPRLALLAAVANSLAAAELVAMLLVQLAVKSVAPHPDPAFTSIWLGLDVAWDLFGGVGTVLFGVALCYHPRFRPLMAGSGILVGMVLLILNIATFPTPPASAGLIDVGPIVGLWYTALLVRVLAVSRLNPPQRAV
jgi:hypothetical protein